MDTRVAAISVRTLDGANGTGLPDFLMDDGDWLGDATAVQAIVLPDQAESRARALLEMGAARVYVGEAALHDSELVTRLVSSYGSEAIGVYVPCRRMEVSWSLDTVSNADFSVVTPSICEPAWEILRADGGPTGTHAGWWIGEMFERGASAALLRVDIADDADLNICAALVDAHGERLWLAPRSMAANRLSDWVRWGGATQLAVAAADFANHPDVQSVRSMGMPAVQEAA